MSHGHCVGDRPDQPAIDLTDPDQPDEASPEAKALVELIAAWLDEGASEPEISRRIRQARGLPPRPRGKPAQRCRGSRVPR